MADKTIAEKMANVKVQEPKKVKMTITLSESERDLLKCLAAHLEVSVSDLIADNLLISYLTHENEVYIEFAKIHPEMCEAVLTGR